MDLVLNDYEGQSSSLSVVVLREPKTTTMVYQALISTFHNSDSK